MRSILVFLLLIQSMVIVAFGGGTEDLLLDCREKIYKEDQSILNQAPSGAKRMSKHHLRVNWSGGSKDFIDKPPYDEPLAGFGIPTADSIRFLKCI